MATKTPADTIGAKKGSAGAAGTDDLETARARLADTGRNDTCPCGSGKKYKKCHLLADEAAASPPAAPPDPLDHVQAGWRLFEQRRPGAAEKEFRTALALRPDLPEAQVGIGLAKLSAGEADAAREALETVIKTGQPVLADLKGQGAKDGFNRKEAQPVLRACHALGCLAFDQDRFEDALVDLERVYSVDTGPVGTEARLIAGKTFVKLNKPEQAIPLLEEASLSTNGPARGQMGLALAKFLVGDKPAAEAALDKALAANPSFGKAVLGTLRKQVDNPLGASPGSREEAIVYAQTYGDVWDDNARAFLTEALAARAAKPKVESTPDEASAG